jgi:hypothetical protein
MAFFTAASKADFQHQLQAALALYSLCVAPA